jgi:hypothetical protein
MGAIRNSASVRTDSVTTHIVRIDVNSNSLPDMGNDDICEIYLQITPKADRAPVMKKIRLNYRDMTTLCSEFVIRDF